MVLAARVPERMAVVSSWSLCELVMRSNQRGIASSQANMAREERGSPELKSIATHAGRLLMISCISKVRVL
jgi:hypothetical protein